jgi:callose synthase
MVILWWIELSGYGLADLDRAKAVRSKAIADIKFTYVVSCQLYGVHKASKDSREKGLYENILNLMLT